MRAVRYDDYGDIDVLEVREVDTPQPGPGEVLVQVRAAGINPGEAGIRSGALREQFPSTFPSGQGSDLAGGVTAVGDGVDQWHEGDEVLGWVDTRASHAEYVVVPADQLIAKPAALDWQRAGAIFVAGSTAWAMLTTIDPQPGETVVVSAAAGGVGSLVVQLLVERGATVLGVAGQGNHDWLREHGVTPVDHAGGLDAVAEALRDAAPDGIDALADAFGNGYVAMARGLGVEGERINTIFDFAEIGKDGVQGVGGSDVASQQTLTEIASRLADGRLEMPVAASYPLAEVRAAFTELEKRHTRGKIVLEP